MSHVICVDGLGGNPEITFSDLKVELERLKHTVHLAPITEITDHNGRIDYVIGSIAMVRGQYPGQRYFLIGQSAGGSAVRCAVAQLSEAELPDGIVLLSSAMPRWIWPATSTLLCKIAKYGRKLIQSEPIRLRDADYLDLIGPIRDDVKKAILDGQVPTPPREARELAFYPAPYRPVGCNVTIIYGSHDRWVRPRAQEVFAKRVRALASKARKRTVVSIHCIKGAGHLTLLHREAIQLVSRSVY